MFRRRSVPDGRRVIRRRPQIQSEPVRIQQPARSDASTFLALPLRLERPLSQCQLIRDILAVPCETRLRQHRYEAITNVSTQTTSWRNAQGELSGTISYCILNSIMTHMVRRNTSRACVAGQITLLIHGAPRSQTQQIIESASRFDLDFPHACNGKQTIYVPMSAYWSSRDPEELLRAAAAPAKNRLSEDGDMCAGPCDSGHAMALIIDNKERTIEYFEPNGKIASWYAVISLFLTRWFRRHPVYRAYRVDEEFCCPPVGIQSRVGLPMCSYFSSMYVAIRLLCQEIPENEVVTHLLRLGKQGLQQLLQRWHCYLLDYDDRYEITGTANALNELYGRVLLQLLRMNTDTRDRNARHERLFAIKTLAFNDVRTAFREMQTFYDELKAANAGN